MLLPPSCFILVPNRDWLCLVAQFSAFNSSYCLIVAEVHLIHRFNSTLLFINMLIMEIDLGPAIIRHSHIMYVLVQRYSVLLQLQSRC